MNCNNCNTEVYSTYCPTCGLPTNLQRIDGRYMQREIEHVLEIERGIFYTIKELALHPGQTIKTYLTENRSRLVKPIIFIIITSLIYTLLDHYFQIEDGYVQYGVEKESATGVIFKWVQDHYGYANIIMGVFISLWVKLLFRKYDYNFFEILILLCFVMGMGMLIFSVFVILQGLTHVNLMTMGGIVGIGYAVWAIGQFFDRTIGMSYVKSLIAYMAGMVAFWLTAFLIGTVIDLIIKH